MNKPEKIKIGLFQVTLLEDGKLKVWAEDALVIHPKTDNHIEINTENVRMDVNDSNVWGGKLPSTKPWLLYSFFNR